jgi:hypothetical protein
MAGGVAANGPLRQAMQAACEKAGISYHAPLLQYCTDNGAMVARTAEHLLAAGRNDGWRSTTRGPIKSWYDTHRKVRFQPRGTPALHSASWYVSRRRFASMTSSLELGPGILGLLGPNGAGKSTLMRIRDHYKTHRRP